MTLGRRLRLSDVLTGAILSAIALHAYGADVTVVGLLNGKAVVVINNGAPHVMGVGDEFQGIKLLSTGVNEASLLVDGKRQTLQLGQFYGSNASVGRASITIPLDASGHYFTTGAINGGTLRFLVDTGATFISISSKDADRLGLHYRDGPKEMVNTANGTIVAYHVALDTVKVGDIVLNHVDAVVHESGLTTPPLLGMSFLNRTEIGRDGQNLVLTKRY